jgi:hypothetical protein
MEFGDLFSFDKKIAPTIIKPLYWIGLVLIVLSGIVFFFSGFLGLFSHFWAGIWTMLSTIVMVPLSVLGLRIAAEVALAVFDIQDRMTGGSPTSQV